VIFGKHIDKQKIDKEKEYHGSGIDRRKNLSLYGSCYDDPALSFLRDI